VFLRFLLKGLDVLPRLGDFPRLGSLLTLVLGELLFADF